MLRVMFTDVNILRVFEYKMRQKKCALKVHEIIGWAVLVYQPRVAFQCMEIRRNKWSVRAAC